MPRVPKKALKLSTEIDVHAVSCPGVWLPGRGRVSLSLCLLGFHTRTGRLPPVFPIMFHEKFKFERTFIGVTNLSVLEKVLESETAYLELVQEEDQGETVLSVFESSVRDLLFPRRTERLSYSGVDLDLLMEPTRDFPGIISPKIEISTRTNIGETRTPLHECAQDTVSFGHSQNKSTKATYRPVSANHSEPKDEEMKKAVAFDSEELNEDRPKKTHFSFKRPESNLLSHIPRFSPKTHRYLGIRSRYLSNSAGNLSDLTRPTVTSRYGIGAGDSSSKNRSRRRKSIDSGHDAKVTMVEQDRCPHCDGEHGADSCTTCRTYHRYFPRPDNPKSHYHSHTFHGRPHSQEAGLKVLQQSSVQNGRRRKKYLVDIGSQEDTTRRRPSSAPPNRLDSGSDDEKSEEEAKPKNRRPRSGTRRRKTSQSRSPSPPPSNASAPPILSRRERVQLIDSEDDWNDDYLNIRRRYGYPYYYTQNYYPYDLDCPLCDGEPYYPSRYYRQPLQDSKWWRSYSDLYRPKHNCYICYKYGHHRPYYPYESYKYRMDYDNSPILKSRHIKAKMSQESTDEVQSDVYDSSPEHSKKKDNGS